jgi:PAS domain S-box-containing protein
VCPTDLLRIALDDLPFGLAITGGSRLLYVNDALCANIGYSRDALMELPSFFELLREEDREGVARDLHDALGKKPGAGSGEARITRSNGESIHIAYLLRLIERGGRVQSYLFIRDITERRESELALRDAETRFRRLFATEDRPDARMSDGGEPLEEGRPNIPRTLAAQIHQTLDSAEERIRQVLNFSSFASHELRNPLTVMRSSLESALSWDTPVDDLRKRLTQVYNEVLHLIHTVELLLDLGRMQAGTLKLELRSTHLAPLLEEFFGEARLVCAQSGLECRLSAARDAVVLADPHYLHRILWNLLDNACKHTDPGGRIDVGCSIVNNDVVLRFADNGSGIPPEEVPRIFEPFFKGSDPGSEDVKGAGLGLALMKWIVDAHAGRITVESDIRRGTTFEIHLPLVQG